MRFSRYFVNSTRYVGDFRGLSNVDKRGTTMSRIKPGRTIVQVREECPAAYKILEYFMMEIAKTTGVLNLGLEKAMQEVEELFDDGYFKITEKKEDGHTCYVLQKWFEDKDYYADAVDAKGRRTIMQID